MKTTEFSAESASGGYVSEYLRTGGSIGSVILVQNVTLS